MSDEVTRPGEPRDHPAPADAGRGGDPSPGPADREEPEARRRQSERLEVLGQFASILAHDVRNYLTTVSWSAEVIAETLGPGHPSLADVALIRQAAADGLAVARSVLEFARPLGEVRGATDMATHLEGTAGMLRRVLGEHVRLEIETAPDLPEADISAAALTQVLVNLATNARDAMPDGGELRITVTRVPATAGGATTTTGVVRMEVRDSGVGMDEVTRLRAFEAFYTTKTGVSPSAGIGLGLSSVLLIVQRAGGTIHVDSVPGAGTTFTIDLPVVEA